MADLMRGGDTMPTTESRRHILTQLATAGVAGLSGLGAAGTGSFAAEPPPEITAIRLEKAPAGCLAPEFVVEGLPGPKGLPTSVTEREMSPRPYSWHTFRGYCRCG